MNDLRRWRQVIDAHEAYDELVLWYEHDLFDQLNLLQILSRMRTRLPAGKVVLLHHRRFVRGACRDSVAHVTAAGHDHR